MGRLRRAGRRAAIERQAGRRHVMGTPLLADDWRWKRCGVTKGCVDGEDNVLDVVHGSQGEWERLGMADWHARESESGIGPWSLAVMTAGDDDDNDERY